MYSSTLILDVLSVWGMSQDSVSIVTALQAGRSGVQIPSGARDISLFPITHIVSEAHLASYLMDILVLSQR
jgi:hypothetical protein